MLKKIRLLLMVTMILLSLSTVFASESKIVNTGSTKEIFSLSKDWTNAKVYETDQVVYGKATASTKITFQLYTEKTDTIHSVVEKVAAKPTDKKEVEWELVSSEEWAVGATAIFANPITLSNGKNKLVFAVEFETGKKINKEYKVEVIDKKEIRDKFNDLILKPLDKNYK